MNETTDTTHPFGHHITVADLLARFDTCRAWEDRYRQLILLAKALPTLPDALKTEDISLSGCENRVWLGYQRQEDGRLHFYGDSDGRIVRGLLAVLLTAVEEKRQKRYYSTIRWRSLTCWGYALSSALHVQVGWQRWPQESGTLQNKKQRISSDIRATSVPLAFCYFPDALSIFAIIFFSAWDTATNPKVAVTIVAAPKPDAQSIRITPSAVLRDAQTEPSGCG